MTSVDEFRKRIEDQRQTEIQAMDLYAGFAAELEKSKYQALFIAISKEEERHAEACDRILEVLNQV